ncbi:hypothetical protein DFQ27_008054 [Actinomortierella ambigua]|uniref:DUF410-domain-containing protein n=1 Tax=Actinomortierella ambigua TaxID=1343610 RepID=A0A9P6QJB8_9FUNG|nr:hypothetical protein DFQ27_008054 [Actinomortierella ambigua]
MAAAKGTARVLKKLEKSVQDGNFYEAHQMYRTVANRYVKSHTYGEAIELLYSGAMLLLKKEQYGSGSDLAIYLVEVYVQAKIPVSDETRDRIFDLADLMGKEVAQRKKFLQNAISWSASNEYPNGDPLLQHYLGVKFWKEKDFPQAEAHLLVGTQESAEALGLALFEWSEQEPQHDKGAYLLRGVLQVLAMKNLRDANTVFRTFVDLLPVNYKAGEARLAEGVAAHANTSVRSLQTYRSSLINLAQLLLLACQTGNPIMYKQLAAKYKPVLAIDENFGALLVTVGELFFDVRAPRQVNALADLMNSLFSGPPAPSSNTGNRINASRAQPAIEEMD